MHASHISINNDLQITFKLVVMEGSCQIYQLFPFMFGPSDNAHLVGKRAIRRGPEIQENVINDITLGQELKLCSNKLTYCKIHAEQADCMLIS